MKKHQAGASPNTPKKVQTVRSASERRAERQIEQALSHPDLVEDWDELDFGVLEHRNHKAVLE